jgi:hypothetical protein
MQPSILSVSPAQGSPFGGDLVRITGRGFGPQVVVYIGEREARVLARQYDAQKNQDTINVRTDRGAAGLVDVRVDNLDDHGIETGERAISQGAFRYLRQRLAQDTTLTDLIRELLKNIRDGLLANTAISASVEYSTSPVEDGVEVLPVVQLPALVLSGPRVEVNRFYSANTVREEVINGQVIRHSPMLTVDLIFSLIGASRSTPEVLNLAVAAMTWLNRQRSVTIDKNTWELEMLGKVNTNTEQTVRSFHLDLIVRGFDIDEGHAFDLTARLQKTPTVAIAEREP